MVLIDETIDTINKSFQELGTRSRVATRVIKFLNSNSSEVLKIKGVKEGTTMVMEDENIFKKINFIWKAQNKCIMLKRNIESFIVIHLCVYPGSTFGFQQNPTNHRPF
jgi:hypothetical protein